MKKFINKKIVGTILAFLFWAILIISLAARQDPELLKELAERKKIVAERPNDADARFELAMAMAYTGYLEEGWAELVKVNEIDKKYSEKVIKKYSSLLEKNPDDWKVRFRLAFGYYFDGFLNKERELVQKKNAIEQFQAIVEKYPKNVWSYNYMGYVFADTGNIPRAILIWRKSISIDQTIPATHFVLGHAYLRTGRYVDGVSEIALAVRLRAMGN